MRGIRTLTYCPELNEVAGSIIASLLMSQLEYWFEKKVGKSFFKFLAPCEHDYYKAGDSWVEELGVSKAEFRHAFSKIGVSYKSKTAYLESKDPFAGKMYLSYYDRIKKITVYERNHQLVDGRLKAYQKSEDYPSQQTESGINKDYKIQSLPQRVDTERVVDMYHTACPSLPKVEQITIKHKQMIEELWRMTKGNLEVMGQVFAKVERSDFLCGRLSNSTWKGNFDWIIQSDNFDKIRQGRYDTLCPERPKPVFLRTYTHNFDIDKLERMEMERLRQHRTLVTSK